MQKVLRSSLVIGWCRQLASCVLSLAKRGSYGSGALPALVALMSVCVCDLRCWWHGMAAVCVRHSDVSGVWASLGCKCLFASVCGALALVCCVGMGRCMRGGGQGSMSWRACAHCHRECHCNSLSCSFHSCDVPRALEWLGWRHIRFFKC